MPAFLWRWRRRILAVAFGICVAATMLVAAERKFYEDTLEAFDRVQIGMDWNEADDLLMEPYMLGRRLWYKHPERFLKNHRMEWRRDAGWYDVYRVGDYRLEIVLRAWGDHTVVEKRRNPEPWMSLVMVRRLFRSPIDKIWSYFFRDWK
jgi:hypothetical protein